MLVIYLFQLICSHCSPCVASIFALLPHGRRCVRSLVSTTDSRYCLHHLTEHTNKREKPWLPLARHSAGNCFGFLLTKEGKPERQAGEYCGAPPGLAASLVIRRTRIPSPGPSGKQAPRGPCGEAPEEEWAYESLLPERCLRGLIPAALLDTHCFCESHPPSSISLLFTL